MKKLLTNWGGGGVLLILSFLTTTAIAKSTTLPAISITKQFI